MARRNRPPACVCVLSALFVLAPAPGEAPRNVRIVDYGADMCGFVYNPYRGRSTHQCRLKPFIDKDRSGTLDNDSVTGWQFSLTEPLNFPYAPFYDLRQKSARLYGGLMLYAVNNPQRWVSEGAMNANHESRDDFNFMGLGPNEPIPPDELSEAYALWFWQKADFLNDGDENRVSFDGGSFIAAHISRYWGGLDNGRWLARDGGTFYVSKKTFGDIDELMDAANVRGKYKGRCPMTHKTFVLKPTETTWAVYKPTEATAEKHCVIDFNAEAADFQPHEFKDVTAVGFLVTRRLAKTTPAVTGGLPPTQALALKWNAFRCDAVVHRPEKPGYFIEMEPTPYGKGLISRWPISFAQWEFIRRIGVTNQHCRGLGDLGYGLRSDGVMGTMETDGKPHAPGEFVDGITWIDAVVWCNMLSEYEGLTPVYYADPHCKTVLRRAVDRDVRENWLKVPAVYWKCGADGYRLPLRLQTGSPNAYEWSGPWTSPGEPFHVSRNVGSGDDDVAEREAGEILIYRDEAETAAKAEKLAKPARAEAQKLKFVRLPVGLATSADRDPTTVFAAQRIVNAAGNQRFLKKITDADYEKIKHEHPLPDVAGRKPYELLVGATEVPYRTWIAVRRWAERKGYRFNYPGDMGSMRTSVNIGRPHSPDEPVAHISWHDALVWCNALSELTGRRCIYYTDPELTTPYRRAVNFRVAMQGRLGYPVLPPEIRKALGQKPIHGRPVDTNCAVLVYLDADADGFRLPFTQEFDKLLPVATRKPADLAGQTLANNGLQRTRPVTAGQPDRNGLYELNGSLFEWAWSPEINYLGMLGQYPLNGFGCYAMTAQQTAGNRRRYVDLVHNARPYFGLRVVRRADEK